MPMTDEEWERFERGPALAPFHHRGPAAISVRRALFAAQEGICGICGQPLGQSMRTVDHVIPKARGGFDRVGNFVIAHYPCNFDKADRPPTGCELVWLLAVNCRLGVEPMRW